MRSNFGHLLVTHPTGRQEAIPLHGADLRIGSAAGNDLVLVGHGIAPCHATVRRGDQGDLFITIAGMEIELPRSSASMAVLRIGGYVLHYVAGSLADHSNGYVMVQASQPAVHARVDEADLLTALLARDEWAADEPQLSDAHEAITIEMQALTSNSAD